MIDTVHFELQNLHKYPLTFKKFYALYEKTNTVVKTYVDESTGELSESTFNNTMVFGDTGNHLPVSYRSNFYVPSSHYTISYTFSPAKLSFSFNLSIPKEVYGSNVLQFVTGHTETAEGIFRKLIDWFISFFQKYFPEAISLYDVRLFRVDLCFNQLFNSKDDALAYLAEQKKFVPQYNSKGNSAVPYNTGIYYVTRGYTFKIYHKGSEFKKNEYNDILAVDNPLSLPLNLLQDGADRMLRYEIEYRSAYFNKMLTAFLYPFDTENFIPHFMNNPIVKLLRTLREYGYQDELKMYKTKSKQVYLKADVSIKNISQFVHEGIVPFCFEMLEIMKTNFWLKMEDWQVASGFSYVRFNQKVAEYEKRQSVLAPYGVNKVQKRKTVDKARMAMIASMIQGGTFFELKNKVSKHVWYRIKRDFKTLGVDLKSGDILFESPPLTYNAYYQWLSTLGMWIK